MIGAIIGDIAGSRFEFFNYRNKDFELFNDDCFFTDDTVMTLAVAKAIKLCDGNYDNLSGLTVKSMREIGRKYPDCDYGGKFYNWMFSLSDPQPYYSFGNGAAMRVSACGFFAKTLEQAKELSYKVTSVTHDHPEGIKGAEAVAVAIFLAKSGKDKAFIKKYVQKNYYDLNFKIDDIRDYYKFDETCQGSVPQAIKAFIESNGFEDAIRIAVSLGGDSDTIGAITGSIAEAYYGVPEILKQKALSFLDKRLLGIYNEVESIEIKNK